MAALALAIQLGKIVGGTVIDCVTQIFQSSHGHARDGHDTAGCWIGTHDFVLETEFIPMQATRPFTKIELQTNRIDASAECLPFPSGCRFVLVVACRALTYQTPFGP